MYLFGMCYFALNDRGRMLQIGRINQLKISRFNDFGAYLVSAKDAATNNEVEEVLLPNRFLSEQAQEGDELNVFVYLDSEDRLVATTETPLAQVDEFAVLKVVSISRIGAFLDWGLSKDLLLPFAEQTQNLSEGKNVVVYVYVDNSDRIAATMRVEKYIKEKKQNFTPEQKVELLVYARTDLGYKAIALADDGSVGSGLLFSDEVFQKINYAQKLSGFIKQIRPDGKIDLKLMRAGHRAAADEVGPQILEQLEEAGGFLPINDKTHADKIYEMFGVSKNKYKLALGNLYKNRRITIEDDGIRLVKAKK